VVCAEGAHIIAHEAAAEAVLAGAQTRPIPVEGNLLTASLIAPRLRRRELHEPATSLIEIENATAFGRVMPLFQMKEIRQLADTWGLPIHLDGARIFNAATVLGCDVREIAQYADSVMFCLSKGLCAPVGSLLAGPQKFIGEARMKRKIMGGGMRQAGILAAAGIIALTDMTKRLGHDHAHAKRMAAGLAKIKGIQIDIATTEIDMVWFTYPPAAEKTRNAEIVKKFAEAGVKIGAADSTGTFRFVCHHDVSEADVDKVLELSKGIF
jgi:threonine aldolase